jgi:hypothetical protein
MADINLTCGRRPLHQPESQHDEWNTIFGLEGNDVIRLYQGGAVGGPGNDTLERIAHRRLVAYGGPGLLGFAGRHCASTWKPASPRTAGAAATR